jgi:leader peptidase (prepilin peptidase)/N-methyltransferase
VVIYRLPVMMEKAWQADFKEYFQSEQAPNDIARSTEPFNLAKPRSTCPHCQHTIRWYENIPIVSWCLLKAKCSQCKNPISIRYPSIELLTGILSGLIAWQYGFTLDAGLALIFCWFLIAMTFIDIDKMLLPDQLTLPLLWIGLIASISEVFSTPVASIIGAAAGYLILWGLYWAFKLLTGKEGMGYGDFKLLAAIGAWLGWQALPLVILLSSVVGTIVGIAMIVSKGNEQRNTAIPFGPYLAAAGLIAMLFGDPITDFYWQFILV